MNIEKWDDIASIASPLMSWDIFMEARHHRMQLIDDVHQLRQLSTECKWQNEFDFDEQLLLLQRVVLVTDINYEIKYASSNLYLMNGYTATEVVGKRPSMFQGPATSSTSRAHIRDAVKMKVPFEAMVVNYKKNGDTYDCHIKGFPLFDQHDKLVNFIAFEYAA